MLLYSTLSLSSQDDSGSTILQLYHVEHVTSEVAVTGGKWVSEGSSAHNFLSLRVICHFFHNPLARSKSYDPSLTERKLGKAEEQWNIC